MQIGYNKKNGVFCSYFADVFFPVLPRRCRAFFQALEALLDFLFQIFKRQTQEVSWQLKKTRSKSALNLRFAIRPRSRSSSPSRKVTQSVALSQSSSSGQRLRYLQSISLRPTVSDISKKSSKELNKLMWFKQEFFDLSCLFVVTFESK